MRRTGSPPARCCAARGDRAGQGAYRPFEADLTPAERDYYALAEAEERQLRDELEAEAG